MPPRKSTRQRKKRVLVRTLKNSTVLPKEMVMVASLILNQGHLQIQSPEPGPAKNAVTWPSEPKYWKQGLPLNHSKRLYLYQNRSEFTRKCS